MFGFRTDRSCPAIPRRRSGFKRRRPEISRGHAFARNDDQNDGRHVQTDASDKLPPDFETRMNKVMDDYMKNLPFDEMLQAMIPAYQKHLTKGDINALVVFYSSPTGQKLIQELPAITAEAMQSIMPLMRKQIDAMTTHVREEVAQMIEASKAKSGQNAASSPN